MRFCLLLSPTKINNESRKKKEKKVKKTVSYTGIDAHVVELWILTIGREKRPEKRVFPRVLQCEMHNSAGFRNNTMSDLIIVHNAILIRHYFT